MSLILDALNRARQETEEIPGLASEHFAGVSPGVGNRRLILLLVALFSALSMIVWLLLDRNPVPAPLESGTGQAEAVSPLRQQPEPTVTAPALGVNKIDRQAVIAPVQEADRVTPDRVTPDRVTPDRVTPDRVTPDQVAPDRAPPDPVAPDLVAPDVAALYRQKEAPAASAVDEHETIPKNGPAAIPAPPVREEQAVDIEQLVAQARDELANAGLQDHEEPFLATLSQQTKDGIPTIMYQRHDYSGTPSRSNVVLNGKTLRVGAEVAGLKVEEILPDSVVLSYRGTRFRLRALNSWVNL